MFRKPLRTALLCVGASLLAFQAHAISITDVSVQTSEGIFTNPSAAYLGQGKAKKAAINALTGLFAGDPWKPLDKTNKPSKPFDGVNFTLTADTGMKAGEWDLAWTESNLPQTMDFILLVKGGRKWGAYLFEAGSIFSDSGKIDGLFEMSLLNNFGKVAKLRKATIFGRVAAVDAADSQGGSWTYNDSVAPTIIDGASSGSGSGGTAGADGSTGGDGGTAGSGGNGSNESGNGDTTGAGGAGAGSQDGGSFGGAIDADARDIPAPGSLALVVLGLGLGLRQFSRRRA